ncbi:MAG: response regulator [Candidatus Thiodiazotropha sp.]
MSETKHESGNIVIVDDNPNNLRVLGEMLQKAGYKVRPAVNSTLALHSIERFPPDLVLLDIRMPGLSGYDVCRHLKESERLRDIPVIFISALHETEGKLAAFKAGGVDYISKPFQIEEVLARVQAHLGLYRMKQNLETIVAERTEDLRKSYEEIQRSKQQYWAILEQMVQAIALTVEKRDPYTAGHQRRVAELATAIAIRLGLSHERREGLRFGAMLHDIGKIHLPAEILSRPGELSPNERSLIMTHAEEGSDIVRDVEFPWPVAQLILQHHERLDGSGYPLGLKGNEILEEARILAVADVVEAMTSHRPYRPALGLEVALDEVKSGSGTRYDEASVNAVVSLVAEGVIKQTEQGGTLVRRDTDSAIRAESARENANRKRRGVTS